MATANDPQKNTNTETGTQQTNDNKGDQTKSGSNATTKESQVSYQYS